MTRRKTDGERIALKAFFNHFGFTSKQYENKRLSKYIDRIIRRRMGEAWEAGWFDRDCRERHVDKNPYRGRKRK